MRAGSNVVLVDSDSVCLRIQNVVDSSECVVLQDGKRYLPVSRFGYMFFIPEASIPGGIESGSQDLKDDLLSCDDWLFVERMIEPAGAGFRFGLDGLVEPGVNLYSLELSGIYEKPFCGSWIEIIDDPGIPFPFGIVTIDIKLPGAASDQCVLSVSMSMAAPFVGLYFSKIHPWAGVHELMSGLSSSRTLLEILRSIDTYFSLHDEQDPCFKIKIDGFSSEPITYIAKNGLFRHFSSSADLFETLKDCESRSGYVDFLKSAYKKGWISSLVEALSIDLDL